MTDEAPPSYHDSGKDSLPGYGIDHTASGSAQQHERDIKEKPFLEPDQGLSVGNPGSTSGSGSNSNSKGWLQRQKDKHAEKKAREVEKQTAIDKAMIANSMVSSRPCIFHIHGGEARAALNDIRLDSVKSGVED